MKRALLLLFLSLVFLGCDQGTARLEWVDTGHNHQFYLETFDPSMITLRYIDAANNRETFTLSEDMVEGELPQEAGRHWINIRYKDAELGIWFDLLLPETMRCTFEFIAVDQATMLDLGYFSTTGYETAAHPECELKEMIDPWDIEGFSFTNFSEETGALFASEHTVNVYLYYESHVYTVRFFDHHGDVIETIAAPHGMNLDHYQHAFPVYYNFVKWDKDLNSIHADIDVYPEGQLAVYLVTFIGFDDQLLNQQYVKHGQTAVEPYVPEVTAHEHVGFDLPLENITGPMTITALYEPLRHLQDYLDPMEAEQNYTVSIFLKNIPYGDGTALHTFKIDKQHTKAHHWEETYYLIEEDATLYIIAQYEDDPTWIKTVHLGETVKEAILIDLFAFEQSMLSRDLEGLHTILPVHHETLFGGVAADIRQATVSMHDASLTIHILFDNDSTATISIYDINETEIILPEYETLNSD